MEFWCPPRRWRPGKPPWLPTPKAATEANDRLRIIGRLRVPGTLMTFSKLKKLDILRTIG